MKTYLLSQYLTQLELAKQVGVNYTAINHWVNGRRKINKDHLEKIRNFLKLDQDTFDYLLLSDY